MFTDGMTLSEALAWERSLTGRLDDRTLSRSEREQISDDLTDIQAKVAELQDAERHVQRAV